MNNQGAEAARWNISRLFAVGFNKGEAAQGAPDTVDCRLKEHHDYNDIDNGWETHVRGPEGECDFTYACMDPDACNGLTCFGGGAFYLAYQGSRSRDLYHVVSLLLQSAAIQTALWLAIGEPKRAIYVWTTVLSAVTRRIKLPCPLSTFCFVCWRPKCKDSD